MNLRTVEFFLNFPLIFSEVINTFLHDLQEIQVYTKHPFCFANKRLIKTEKLDFLLRFTTNILDFHIKR